MKSRHPKRAKSGMMLGVAWYREADWSIKELFPDADELHDTHAEWVKSAEASVKRLTRAGVTVEPYTIDLDDFLGWCTVLGCECDAKARTAAKMFVDSAVSALAFGAVVIGVYSEAARQGLEGYHHMGSLSERCSSTF